MSPVLLPCTALLLVLLACCQSAQCARPLGFGKTAEIVQNADSSQKSNLTNNKKDGLKMNLTEAQGTSRFQTASVIQKSGGSKDNMEVTEMATRSSKTRSTNHSSTKRNNYHKVKVVSKSGSGGTKVTYRLPQQKRGEQQPGFNLDYSPPKVHPPHHN